MKKIRINSSPALSKPPASQAPWLGGSSSPFPYVGRGLCFMRRVLILSFLLLCFGGAQTLVAQVTNYAFTNSTGTFTALTTPTTLSLSGGNTDDGYYNNVPIGFDFWYMGSRYTTVSASTNGWMIFNTNITDSAITNSLSGRSGAPVIAPLWDDIGVNDATSSVSYKLTGTAPSRVFTIQYLNARWQYNAAGVSISFQVRLSESTGKVEFIYRPETGLLTAPTASIGITDVANGSGNFLSVTNAGTAINSTTEQSVTTKPVSGKTYTFTPPVPTAPTALTFSSVATTSMTLNWTDNSGAVEDGFVIYRSTDDVTYTFVSQTAANATSSAQSGLTASTTYYWKVYAVSEGAFSTALSGNQITAAVAKTFTGTGNFSDPARWTGGTVPIAGENLVIDGACTIDNNASTDNVAYGTLVIGTATGRTLNWAVGGTNRLNVTSVSAGAGASTLSMTNGGTLSIGSMWTSTNLTFTPGAGTIEARSTMTLPAAYATYNNLTINAPSATVTAGVSTTVSNFSINSGTLNLNTFTLTITGTATYTSGTINNGTATSSGSTTTFAGTVFGAVVNATSGALSLNGSTFNNTVTLTKNGAGTTTSAGGNTFNGIATISLSGTGAWVLGNAAPDIFQGNVVFTNTGSNGLFVAHNSGGNQFNGNVTFNNTGTGGTINSGFGALSAAAYNGNIIVNNTSASGMSFGFAGGLTTLAATKTITIGGTGFTAGPLYLYYFTQLGTTPQALTLTGTGTLVVGIGSTFNGNVSFIAPGMLLNGGTYNGTAYIEKNGAGQNNSLGGNVFNGATTIVSSSPGAGDYFVLGHPTGIDIFNGDLTLTNTGASGIFPAYSTPGHQFNGNIILNQTTGSSISFNAGTGTSTLAAGKTITVGGLGFSAGTLNLPKFTQMGTTAQALTLTGTAVLRLGPATTFNGNTNFSAPQLYLNGATYNGTTSLTKTGATNNNGDGGNTFASTTTITNSGTGWLALGYISPDIFNGETTFNNNSSGGLYIAHNAAGNQFNGNVTYNNLSAGGNIYNYFGATATAAYNGNIVVNNTSSGGIYFGAAGGTATLAATKTITIGATGFGTGILSLWYLTQSGTTPQALTLTGTALLQTLSVTFNGNVNFIAPQLILNGTTYNGTASFTKNGATDNTSDGGNIFNSTATITNSGTGFLRLGNTTADDFNGDATFVQTGSGFLQPSFSTNSTFAGNLSSAGTATPIIFGTGAGTVTLDGTGAQSTAGALSTTFNNLTINNGSGITLGTDTTVNGVLTFTSGRVTTNSNSLYLGSGGSVARTSGHVNGNFKKHVATGATSKTFEIGDAANYTPVTVAFASVGTAGDLTASVVSGDHANIGSSTINAAKSVNRNWTLTNSGITFTTYDVTFTFVPSDVDGAASTSVFIAGKYSSGWTYPTVGTKTATTTQATGLTAFSDFAIGEMTSLLKTWDGGAGTTNWGDAANWNTDGVPTSANDVDLTGADTININVAAVANTLTLNNAGLTLTILSGNSLATSGNLTLTSGTLNTAEAFPTVAGTVNVAGGTVGFTGSGAQTIPAHNYNNLTSSSTGARTLAGSGTIGIAGTFVPGANTYTITGSTIDYEAAGAQTVAAFNYNNLTLSNSGAKTFAAGTSGVAAALAITGSATANTTTNSSTISYNGSTNQSITALTYYGLNISSTGGVVTGINRTVTTFSINSGTLDLNTFTLTITGTSTFTSGTINNGTVTTTGQTTTFAGTTFGAVVNATSNNLSLNGSTFNNTAAFTKTGATGAIGTGGNTYNGVVTIANSGSATFDLGNTLPETFNADLTVNNTGTSRVQIGVSSAGNVFNGNVTINNGGNTPSLNTIIARSAGSTATFNGNLILNNTNTNVSSGIIIANTGQVTVTGNITVSSTAGRGVLFGDAAGTVTLANGFTIATAGAGTFTTGTLTLKGFTQTGGTAQNLALTGTAILQAGPTSQFNGAVDFSAPQLLLNGAVFNSTAVLTKNGATDNTSLGTNVFNGATTITNSGTGFMRMAGTFSDNFNADATFIQTGSGLLQPAYAGNSTFAGNVSTAGTTTAIIFGAGTGTVTLNGTAAQSISGSLLTTFRNLTINNGSGVTLGTNVTVNGVLTLTSGTVTTSSNELYLGSAGSVARTSGHVVGNFKKHIATGATTKTFEIGDASNYTPVAVAFASVTTAGNLTAKAAAGDHANIGTSTIVTTKSVNRNWTLINSGIAFTNYGATFTFVAGDVDGGATTSAFIVGEYSSGWTYPTVGTRTLTTTQATGITTFGDFQIGEMPALPPNVSLINSVTPSGTQPPGTDLAYNVVFTNDGGLPAQTFVVVDPIPANTDFKLGSASTVLGTTGLTVTIAYSNDNGVSYTYIPVSAGGGAPAGYDRVVTHVRWTFGGNLSQTSPNNSGSVSFTARVR